MTYLLSTNAGSQGEPAKLSDGDWYHLLSAAKRRRVLAILSDRATALNTQDLATEVVAAATDKPLLAVTRAEARKVHTELQHSHLPKLEDAGLVTLTDDSVSLVDRSILQNPRIKSILHTNGPDWDAVLDCLANERQRIALRVLSQYEAPIDRALFAERLRDAILADTETQVSIEEVRLALHHHYLPKLAAAGLIIYDRSAETVSYEGHPSLPEEFLYTGLSENPQSILSAAKKSPDIWSIDGKANVIEQGRSLFDTAEEELFLMITTDGLVEERCILKLQAAVERGVDVYIGSQTDSVRAIVRERVPEAVIWEPQMDWLNLPPNHEKVGRLLLADRESIMIGTLGKEGPDGVPRETALVGKGSSNPLVMVLREMLGSRLDHLDEQSEDFRSQIPL